MFLASPAFAAKGVEPHTDKYGHFKVGAPYEIDDIWYYPTVYKSYDRTGIASWYGNNFHGKFTANGEIYNENALTAAHKTLPLPSVIKVTNLDNNATAILTINDRGPYVKDRLLDVSKRAAQQLGFFDKGITKVRVEMMPGLTKQLLKDYKKKSQLVNFDDNELGYFIQLGAFGKEKNADKMAVNILEFGDPTITPIAFNDKTLYRVRIGPVVNYHKAKDILGKLHDNGFNTAAIVH